MSEPRRLTASASIHVGGVTFLGSLLLLASLPGLEVLRSSGPEGLALLVLAACTIGTHLFPVTGPKDEAYQLSSVFIFAGAILLQPGPLALLVVVVFAVEWLRSRRDWHVEAFNAANFLIDAFCARFVYRALAGGESLAGEPSQLAAAVAAALVFTFLNRVLLAVVQRRSEGRSWGAAGISQPTSLIIDTALAGLGILTALLWQVAPLSLSLLLMPLFLIYRALRTPALEDQARTDAKTGLYNSRFLVEKLSEELRRAKRFDRPLTAIVVGIDLPRKANTRPGRLAGEVVLRGVASVLRGGLREYDVAARYRGSSFAIVLPECTIGEGQVVAERIRIQIAAARFAVSTSAEPLGTTISLGVASFPSSSQTPDEIVARADAAMRTAMSRGGDSVLVAEAAATSVRTGQDERDSGAE